MIRELLARHSDELRAWTIELLLAVILFSLFTVYLPYIVAGIQYVEELEEKGYIQVKEIKPSNIIVDENAETPRYEYPTTAMYRLGYVPAHMRLPEPLLVTSTLTSVYTTTTVYTTTYTVTTVMSTVTSYLTTVSTYTSTITETSPLTTITSVSTIVETVTKTYTTPTTYTTTIYTLTTITSTTVLTIITTLASTLVATSTYTSTITSVKKKTLVKTTTGVKTVTTATVETKISTYTTTKYTTITKQTPYTTQTIVKRTTVPTTITSYYVTSTPILSSKIIRKTYTTVITLVETVITSYTTLTTVSTAVYTTYVSTKTTTYTIVSTSIYTTTYTTTTVVVRKIVDRYWTTITSTIYSTVTSTSTKYLVTTIYYTTVQTITSYSTKTLTTVYTTVTTSYSVITTTMEFPIPPVGRTAMIYGYKITLTITVSTTTITSTITSTYYSTTSTVYTTTRTTKTVTSTYSTQYIVTTYTTSFVTVYETLVETTVILKYTIKTVTTETVTAVVSSIITTPVYTTVTTTYTTTLTSSYTTFEEETLVYYGTLTVTYANAMVGVRGSRYLSVYTGYYEENIALFISEYGVAVGFLRVRYKYSWNGELYTLVYFDYQVYGQLNAQTGTQLTWVGALKYPLASAGAGEVAVYLPKWMNTATQGGNDIIYIKAWIPLELNPNRETPELDIYRYAYGQQTTAYTQQIIKLTTTKTQAITETITKTTSTETQTITGELVTAITNDPNLDAYSVSALKVANQGVLYPEEKSYVYVIKEKNGTRSMKLYVIYKLFTTTVVEANYIIYYYGVLQALVENYGMFYLFNEREALFIRQSPYATQNGSIYYHLVSIPVDYGQYVYCEMGYAYEVSVYTDLVIGTYEVREIPLLLEFVSVVNGETVGIIEWSVVSIYTYRVTTVYYTTVFTSTTTVYYVSTSTSTTTVVEGVYVSGGHVVEMPYITSYTIRGGLKTVYSTYTSVVTTTTRVPVGEVRTITSYVVSTKTVTEPRRVTRTVTSVWTTTWTSYTTIYSSYTTYTVYTTSVVKTTTITSVKYTRTTITSPISTIVTSTTIYSTITTVVTTPYTTTITTVSSSTITTVETGVLTTTITTIITTTEYSTSTTIITTSVPVTTITTVETVTGVSVETSTYTSTTTLTSYTTKVYYSTVYVVSTITTTEYSTSMRAVVETVTSTYTTYTAVMTTLYPDFVYEGASISYGYTYSTILVSNPVTTFTSTVYASQMFRIYVTVRNMSVFGTMAVTVIGRGVSFVSTIPMNGGEITVITIPANSPVYVDMSTTGELVYTMYIYNVDLGEAETTAYITVYVGIPVYTVRVLDRVMGVDVSVARVYVGNIGGAPGTAYVLVYDRNLCIVATTAMYLEPGQYKPLDIRVARGYYVLAVLNDARHRVDYIGNIFIGNVVNPYSFPYINWRTTSQ